MKKSSSISVELGGALSGARPGLEHREKSVISAIKNLKGILKKGPGRPDGP